MWGGVTQPTLSGANYSVTMPVPLCICVVLLPLGCQLLTTISLANSHAPLVIATITIMPALTCRRTHMGGYDEPPCESIPWKQMWGWRKKLVRPLLCPALPATRGTDDFAASCHLVTYACGFVPRFDYFYFQLEILAIITT